MPNFAFWYAVFLFGGAVGVTVGSCFGNGLALIAGLLAGMAISGWIGKRLSSNRWSSASASNPEKPLGQPEPSATKALAQGLERIRFASAPLELRAPETMAAELHTLGSFSLPKGMYEFAMRKQIEKQTSAT
jgi:hypothetical protein